MVHAAVCKKPSKACGIYKVYSDKVRFSVVQNSSICGTPFIVRRWKKIYPYINESMVCEFKKHYKTQIKDEIYKRKSPKTVIINKLLGNPCLLENKINPLVQKYLKATRYKGGVVNTMVGLATAKALTKQ